MKQRGISRSVIASVVVLGLVIAGMMFSRKPVSPTQTKTERAEQALQVDSISPGASSHAPITVNRVSNEGEPALPASAGINEPPSSFSVIRELDDYGEPFVHSERERIETLLQTAGATKDPEARRQLWQRLAAELILDDWVVVSEVLGRIKYQSYQKELAAEYAELLSRDDPQQAIVWVEGVNDDFVRNNTAYTVGAALARSDITLATQWVEYDLDSNLRASAVEGIAYEWAQRDADAAYEWAVSQLDDETVFGRAMTKIAQAMSEKDPQEAAMWAAEFAEGAARTQALRYATTRWVKEDPEAAARWVESLPESFSRDKTLLNIAYRWGRLEAEAAVTWALDLLDETLRYDAVTTIGRVAADVSPEKALHLAEQLPKSPMREEVLSHTQRKWVRKDPVAAANAILELTDVGERARLLRHTTSIWTKKDPTGAAEFAESLADPVLREQNLLRVAIHWLNQDRAAAEDWINSSSSYALQNLKYGP